MSLLERLVRVAFACPAAVAIHVSASDYAALVSELRDRRMMDFTPSGAAMLYGLPLRAAVFTGVVLRVADPLGVGEARSRVVELAEPLPLGGVS